MAAHTNQEQIEEILRRYGPLLSHNILDKLESIYGRTRSSAQKALARVAPPVEKVEEIKFPHNEKFFYLNTFGYSQKIKLNTYCNKYQTSDGLLLNALISRDGMCSTKYLSICSGLPIKKASHQALFGDVVSRLEKIEMIVKSPREDAYYYFSKDNRSYNRSKFYFDLEDMVLEELKKLFVKLNFSSEGSIKIRSGAELPNYGSFNWSLTGPCYLDGVKMGDKNGYICCDIFLGDKLNTHNIKPILRKYETTKAQRRKTRFIPAIYFHSMTKKLLIKLREKGFLTISAKAFGGSKFLALLEELREAYANIEKKSDPKQINELMSKAFQSELKNYDNMRGFFI